MMTSTDTTISEQHLAACRGEVQRRVRAGQVECVETLHDRDSVIGRDTEAMLELIYAEYVARRDGGESPGLDSYRRRFPEYGDRLDRLFGLYDLLANRETLREDGADSPSGALLPRAFASTAPARYEVVRELGRGGMAIVFLARQTDLHRDVALKILKAGPWLTAEDDARIRGEAATAAKLSHPNIVPIFEVGEWNDSPYLAFEYIPGGTLAEALAKSPSHSSQEIAAFIALLARTMHYAHEQGVIHRDLKPANILLVDGTLAHPKIADFGLSLAVDASQSQSGIIGTPSYMAPEQAFGRRDAITPAADVYALGAILYEMLSGRPPFVGATVQETLDLVRNTEPVSPRLFRPNLHRDLETIGLKCLNKDPVRRYRSAAELAEDLTQFRDGRPITARPISSAERVWKWCRRRPVIAGLTAGLVLAVAAGVAGISREYLRAESERRIAVERLKQIELINDTVFDIFAEFDIDQVRADEKPVEAVLARKLIEAGNRLDPHAIHDPLVLATLRNRLGNTLISLGEPHAAIDLLAASADVRKAELGADHLDTLQATNDLATAYRATGQPDAALTLLAETVARSRAHLELDHRLTLTFASNMAMVYRDLHRLDDALPLLEKTLSIQKTRLGPQDPDTLNTMNNLALCYHDAGQNESALTLYEETVPLMKARLGADHPRTLTAINNLASGYQDEGRMERALPLFVEVFKLKKAKLGPDHRSTLISMNNLALAYQYADQLDKALPLYEQVLTFRKDKLGPDDPDTLISMNNLASGYQYAGKFDKALTLFAEVHTRRMAKLGPEDPDTITALNNRAWCHRDAGQLDKALPLYRETLTLAKARFGLDHADTLFYMNSLAATYDLAGQFEAAESLYRDRLALLKSKSGSDSSDYAGGLAALGKSLLDRKKYTEAKPLLRDCLVIRAKSQPDHWMTFHTQSLLGAALLGQLNYADAEPLLLRGYEGMKAREKDIPHKSGSDLRIPEALDRLIELYTAINKPHELKKYQDLRARDPRPKSKK